jgi:hypothetical protein
MPRVVQENTKTCTKAICEEGGLPKHIKATTKEGRGALATLIGTSHEVESCLI